MSKSAQSNQAAQARSIRRFVPVSIKPIVVKLTRKLSVTYWPGRRRTISATLLAMLAGFVHSLAFASPVGERVISGSAVVSRPNAATTLVTQGTQNAIINWQSFSIGAGEGVRFVQPNSSAVALNRVVGNDPSRIFGSLSANGKVFLVNTAGVYFAPGASVDVGGLVASSMNISDRNFMAGNYKFDGGANAGAVDNQGMLRGAFVVLAAPQVNNGGRIVTTGGAAALAAGGRVSLDIAGDKLVSMNVDAATANAAVTNSGSISADGGKVFMSAHSANAVLDTVINTSGVVRANSIGMRNGQIVIDGGNAGTVAVGGTLAARGAQAGSQGGSVAVLGDRVSLQAGASVDVSGDAGGGSARIGGDFHGAGALKTASQTQVEKGAAINADAITSGNGGTVAVWSDQHTAFAGSISAKGGAQGGDGGFVETSGKKTLAFSGAVTTKAAKGATGTLLLDPTDITITTNPTASTGYAGGTFSSSADSSNIQDTDLTTALGSTNVIVDASAGGGLGSGNITVGTPIVWNSANSLTLKAANNIDTVGGAINNSGSGAVSLYGDGAITTGAVTTNGGMVEIAGTAGGSSKAGSFTGGGITTNNGNVTVQASGAISTGAIDSGSGTIRVSGDNDVTISGALASANAGTNAIVVKAGAQSMAGVASGGDISIAGGSVTVSGGGRAILYTGSLAGSTGVKNEVGTGSGNFRYNSSEGTDNFGALLGSSGVYAVYREQPTVTVTGSSGAMTYGDSIPALSASYPGLQNGDTEAQALTGALVVAAGGSTSSSGLLTAGAHAVTASGLTDQLGYNVVYAPGTLTVAAKALTMSGLSVPASKVYDGTTAAVVGGAPVLAAGEAVGAGSVSDGKPYTGDMVSFSGTASGTYNSKDVVGASSVAFGGLALAGADGANYSLTMQPAVAATITAAPLTATVTAPNKVYDGNTGATPTLTITAGLVGAETVNASGTASFNSKNVAAATTVTVDTTSLADGGSGGLASNYSLAAGQTTAASITPKALSATITAPNKVYDGTTAATPAVTLTGGLVGTETVSVTSGSASFNTKDVATANTVTLNSALLADGANGGLASNYSVTPGATTSASITPAALTVSLSAPDKVYDGTTIASPTISVTSGLVGSETVNASGAASFNTKDVATANTVTLNSASLADGANGGLASNYSVTPGATTSAHITPAALTVSLTGADKVYDGTTIATPTITVTSGLVGSETVNASGTASFNTKDVLTANQVTLDTAALADGSNGGMASNYSLATGATGAAHITPKALSATITAPNKTYDGTTTATPAVILTGGFVGTETVSVASGSASFNSKDVATANTVTLNGALLADGANGGLASNYSVTPGATTSASITQAALTVSLTGADKVYDGTTIATPTITVTSGLVGSETVNASGTASFNTKDVLTANQVTLDTAALADGSNGGLASNYSLATGATGAAHITPKGLSATITAPNKTYDGTTVATPAVTLTGGLVGTETVSVTSGSASFNTKDVATANTVTLNSALLADGANGGLASNYSVTPGATTSASITPAALTVSLSAPDKVYDGTTIASPTISVTSGLVGSETVNASGAASFNTKDVATANTVTLNSASLADGANGGLASNYSVTPGATASAHITPAALTVSLTGADKVYDGTTIATPTITVTSGLVGSETVNASGTASFNTKDVATANTVTLTSAALADGSNGGLAGNYSVTPGATASAHITRAALTVSLTGADKVYDGTTIATPTITVTGGLVGSETVNASGAASFNTKDVATANTVTLNSASLADGANGGLASNYSVTPSATTSAHITPAALTVSLTGADKVYDGNTNATPTITVTSGLVGSETVTASGTASFNTKDVATANLVTLDSAALADGGNGGLASNYSLATGATGAAHITPKALTATITAPNKTYDGTTVATPTVTLTGGFVGTETVNVTSGSASFNTKDVATAHTVTLNGALLGDGANGGLASNYSVTPGATTSASITPAALTVSLSGADKVYDGNTIATPTVTVTSGLVGTETVTASGTASFNAKDVLTANLVTLDTAALADGSNGGMASNYILAPGATVAAHISPKSLAATIAAPDKVYDGNTTAAPTLTLTGGFIGTETVSVASATANFNSKDVLAANTVTLTGATLADGANGGIASNYSVAPPPTATAHITPAPLTASVSAPDKVYDATTVATPVVTVTGGLVAGESLGVSATGSFSSKDAIVPNQVTVNSITLIDGAGGLASNYSAPVVGTAVAQITPKPLSMSGLTVPSSRTYDGTTSAVVGGTATLQAAEAPGTGSASDGKPYIGDGAGIAGTAVGTYNSPNAADASSVAYTGLSVNGPKASNYSLTMQTPSAATIDRAHITSVSALSSADKVYDGNTSAVLNSQNAVLSGVVPGEVLTIAGGAANFSDRNVGAAKTVTISGLTLGGPTAANYVLDNTTALTTNAITRLPSVTYIGAPGGDWANPANWQGGALPDGANVAQVIIPAGTSVNFTSAVIPLAGSVQLDNIIGGGALNVGSGALTVAQGLNASGYGQSGGATTAGSLTANSLFDQTGGTLAVTGALDIQQAAGTVHLAGLSAGTLAIGGGANVQQVNGTAVTVPGGITLSTGAGDVVLGNANNAFDTVVINSAHNVALATNGGLRFGGTTVGGSLNVAAGGAVDQTGTVSVAGATNISAPTQSVSLAMAGNNFGGALTLGAATATIKDANDLTAHLNTTGATSLTSVNGLTVDGISGALTTDSAGLAFGATNVTGALGATSRGAVNQTGALSVTGASNISASEQNVNLAVATNDFGGPLTLTAATATIKDANALTAHVTTTGATSLASAADLTVDGASGSLTTDSAGLSFGPTTVTGALGATARGAVSQTGKLLVSGASTISAAAQSVDLAMDTNDFGGALTLTAGTATIKDANALTAHLNTAGATNLASVTGLTVDGTTGALTTDSAGLAFGTTNVTGSLGATSRGAVSQTGALSVSGTSNIVAAGQTVALTNVGNDFGGALTLSSAATGLADKNQLVLGATNVTGDLGVVAAGGVSQTGPLSVSGASTISAPGQDVALTTATNDFGGALNLTAGTATIKDANALTAHLTTTGTTSLTSVNGLTVDGSSGALTTDSASLAFGPMTVAGTLGATSRGAVSQTGALSVRDASAISAAGQNVGLAMDTNDFGGALTLTAGTATIKDANALAAHLTTSGITSLSSVAGLTVDGNTNTLTTDSAGLTFGATRVTGDLVATSRGAVNQTGALTVGGTSMISASGQNVDLAMATNDFGGPLSLTAATATIKDANALTAHVTTTGATSLASAAGLTVDGASGSLTTDSAGLSFGATTVTGALGATARGAVSQTGKLSVSGASTISAAAQNVGLAMDTNDFGGALTLTAGTATIKDANALTAHLNTAGATNLASVTGLTVDGATGALTTDSAGLAFGTTNVTGSLGATSRGAVSQTGALSVSGTSNIVAAGQTVALTNVGNDFGGALTLSSAATGLADKNQLVLGATNVTGDLGVVAAGGVSQNGTLSVTGASTISAPGQDVALTTATNDFGGALNLTAGTATIKDANALTAHLTTTGTTSLTSVNGLTVDGSSGALATDSASLAFGPMTVSGTLGATSRGAVSQTGALSVRDASTISASGQDVALTTANNDFGGALTITAATASIKDANDLAAHLTTTGATSLTSTTGLTVDGNSGALTTDSAGLAFGPMKVDGTLGATSRGAVSQTGALSVRDSSTISASGQDVALAMGNDFGGALTITAATASIKDANDLTAHLTTTGATSLTSVNGLAVDGSSGSLTTDSAGLAFGPTTVTGALGATARGAVNQSGTLSVRDSSTISASGQDVALTTATNDFGGALTITAATASIKDANDLTAHLTTTGDTSLASVTGLTVDGNSGALTTDSAGLAFGPMKVDGTLGATSRGAVSQTGALSVRDSSTISASGQDVALASAANDFGGALTLKATTAAIRDANALTAHVTTTGATSLTSAADLAVDGSSGSLTTGSAGLAFGATTVTGALGATARGAVSQTGKLAVSGASTISAAGQNVGLAMDTNDFGGALTLTAGTATIKDANALAAHLTTTGATSLASVTGLTVDGNSGALTTDSAGLAFGPTNVTGALGATSRGAVSQTGALTVTGASTISASGQNVALAMGNDFGGALTLAAATASIKDTNALTAHVTTTGATSLASAAGLTVDGASGALTTDSAGLTFGPTTVAGTLGATARGAVSQTGALSVTGASSISASGQDVALATATNDFGGALTLTAATATIKDANALTAHLTTTGATGLTSVNGLTVDGSSGALTTDSASLAFGPTTVAGTLGATSRGAVSQTGALSVTGASNISASGQDVALATATNDFGGALTLTAATATIKDANALTAHLSTSGATSLTSVAGLTADGSSGALTTDSGGLTFGPTTVSGALAANSRGAVGQTGKLIVSGASNIAATGAVTLTDAANNFTGAVTASSGSNVNLRDVDDLTVGTIAAPTVDLTAGTGFLMASNGLVNSPTVSLTLLQFAKGSIGTSAAPFTVQNNARVTLGTLTPAVPAYFAGTGLQVSVTNDAALREYSRATIDFFLGSVKPYNRVLDDFISQNIVALSKILRDAQKKADSSSDLIDNGMPIDLTERAAYPHAGALKLKEPCKESKDRKCK